MAVFLNDLMLARTATTHAASTATPILFQLLQDGLKNWVGNVLIVRIIDKRDLTVKADLFAATAAVSGFTAAADARHVTKIACAARANWTQSYRKGCRTWSS